MRAPASLQLLTAAILGASLAAPVAAQGYPSKPITFVYPYAPGSNADSAWRLIGQEVSRRLGQSVVHENRPGAGGRVGLDGAIKAAPDGYTISMFNNIVGIFQPLIDPRLAIEPGKDYTPIALCIETPLVLFANASLPFKDMRGLIAYAKANPGKLNLSSPGPGSGGHLSAALLDAKAGITTTHIPYKGTVPANTALVTGEVQLTFTDVSAKPFFEAGKLVAIATGGDRRWNQFPDTPSMSEIGMPDFRNSSWNGVATAPGLPAPVLDRLNRAYNEAINTPDVKAKLEATGWVILGSSPAEFTALIRKDLEIFRPIVKAANIKIE